jgi:hypothetical protein
MRGPRCARGLIARGNFRSVDFGTADRRAHEAVDQRLFETMADLSRSLRASLRGQTVWGRIRGLVVRYYAPPVKLEIGEQMGRTSAGMIGA